jgi:HAD superfamily hydrolase (TIGR01509 family)
MIKLVCFDLDGVLVESKETHFLALNLALSEIDSKYVISLDDHHKKFDGLPTNKKLELLSSERGLPKELHEKIWNLKQQKTFDAIKTSVVPNDKIISLFKQLKADGIKIMVCSNSIKQTIKMFLLHLGLIEWVDDYISNEDVKCPKPNPSMYMKAMLSCSISPYETLIVEDSHVGITAAQASGGNVLIVKTPAEVNIENVYSSLNRLKKPIKQKWKGTKMNILIPMAGAGSRFSKAGYTFPKPLIEVHGKPMIQVVTDNLNIEAKFTYLVRTEDYQKFNLKSMLNVITPDCNIICVDKLTEGAACTTLLAKDIINTDEPLLIANCDQFMEWNSSEFMYSITSGKCDGSILTFQNTSPKWSYVKVDEENYVTELAEKVVISDRATVGIYYWAKGNEYVKYAENMIAKNIRVNNEFYVAPVYNEAIQDAKKIKIFDVEKVWGLGTPEDLNYFLSNFKGTV